MSSIVQLVNKYQSLNVVEKVGERNYRDNNNNIIYVENLLSCACRFHFESDKKSDFIKHYTETQHLKYLYRLTKDGELHNYCRKLAIAKLRKQITNHDYKYLHQRCYFDIQNKVKKVPDIQTIQERRKQELCFAVKDYFKKHNIRRRIKNKVKREFLKKKFTMNPPKNQIDFHLTDFFSPFSS
jgi:hypothetical protein